MNEEFFIILHQIFKFMVIILVGIGCVKFKVLDRDGLSMISKLIIKVALPVFIFSNTIGGATRSDLFSDAIILPLSILLYAVLIAVAYAMAKAIGLKGEKKQVFEAMFIFGNVGFIGIPLIAAVLPEKGMIYIALFTIIDQLTLWTLGVKLTSRDIKGFSLSSLKKMASPPLVAIIAAILVVLSGLKIPYVLEDTLKTVGNASSPLSLIFIGGSLCYCNFKDILKCKEIYIGTIIKMIIVPVIVYYFIDSVLGLPQTMSLTMALISALPTMTTLSMLAVANDMEGDYCISATMLSQIFCLFTLPIVSCILLMG